MKTTTPLGKVSALTLSNFILKNFGPMSHLKLQKLLFYCEAYHLAYFQYEIMDEQFEAWVHGPVCREVYDSLKDTSILHTDLSFDKNDKDPNLEIEHNLNSTQRELLNDVLTELSSWTGIELETATHSERPWIEARKGIPPSKACNNIISKKLMEEFYSQELNG